FRALGRNDAVQPAVHDEQWAGDVLRHALERQGVGVLAGLFRCLAVAAHPKSLTRQFRQSVPVRSPIEWSAERDAGIDAFVESRRAWCVVTTEADAPHAEPGRIEVGTFLHKINHGLHRHLVVAANWEVILCFALAGTFEDQRRDSAREKWRLV